VRKNLQFISDSRSPMTNEARVKLFKLLQNVYRKEKDYRSVVIWENKLQNDIKKKNWTNILVMK
jgi:hypothetical protein